MCNSDMITGDVLQDLLHHRKEVIIKHLSIYDELNVVFRHLLREPLRHKLSDLFQVETQLLTILNLSNLRFFLSFVDEHVGGLSWALLFRHEWLLFIAECFFLQILKAKEFNLIVIKLFPRVFFHCEPLLLLLVGILLSLASGCVDDWVVVAVVCSALVNCDTY